MDARRREYLQAMGVDVWVPRYAAPILAPESEGSSPVLPQPERDVSPGGSLQPGARAQEPAASSSLAEGQALQPPRERGVEVVASFRPGARADHGTSALSSAPGEPLSAELEAQWEGLRAEVLSCKKCTLHTTRTQGVFGVGNRRADWLIIGEAPGAEEDRQGEPFVGRAGQLLNAMLKAIGLQRETVFIANVLKSRPPGNRDPKPEEVAACLPYLMRQIALLQPKLMLAVGRIAAQNLLATDLSLGRLRGQVHTFGELNTPLIVTYHPAYLLRTPADKRKAWEDLKFARSVFQRLASQES
jgi:DNA polymerase